METTFDIVYTGQFKSGLSRNDVLQQFAGRFNVTAEKAATMLPAGNNTILKRNLDRATAEKFRDTLDEIGVVVEIRAAGASGDGSSRQAGSEAAQAGTGGPEDVEALAEQFNPYARAVPKRQAEPAGAGETPGQEDVEILSQKIFEGAVSVPAGNGINWITGAYSNHVQKSLGAWVGAVVIYFVLSIVLSLIPFIGSIALMLVGPVIIGGFMIGAKEQAEGASFTIRHMFSAFEAPGQLMLLALFYFIAMVVIVLLTIALFGASLFNAADPAGGGAPNLYLMVLSILVMLLLMLPVLMAYWFAPALIVLEGMSAFDAMKHSFIGCLKNILPMLVYGLLATVLAVIAAIPLLLGYLLLMPVIVASMYVAYKDIFRSEETVFQPEMEPQNGGG